MPIYWYWLFDVQPERDEYEIEWDYVLAGPPPPNNPDWDDIRSIWFDAP